MLPADSAKILFERSEAYYENLVTEYEVQAPKRPRAPTPLRPDQHHLERALEGGPGKREDDHGRSLSLNGPLPRCATATLVHGAGRLVH